MTFALARLLNADALRLTLLCLSQFVLVLDAAVVAVALPAIQADLALSPAQLQAVAAAYAVTFGGFLILAGRAADAFGARRTFLAGLALFTAASAACALAPSAGLLLLGRGVQGLAAAIASPAALSLLMASTADDQSRTRAFAAWGAVASAGAVAGQILGGALTEALDWRWIFLVNLPLGVAVLALGPRLLPAPAAGARRGGLDVVGAVLLTGGLVLLVLAASQAGARGADGLVVGGAAAGAAALIAFWARQRRAHAPLVRPGLLALRPVRLGNAVSLLAAGASTTVVFLTAIYLQRALGLTTLEVGLGFAPVTAAILVVSSVAARVSARIGIGRTLALGQVLVAGGVAALGLVSPDGSYLADALPGLALVGIGSGLTYAPAMSAATRGVLPDEQGVATGLVSTAQQVGGAVALAVLGTVAFGGHGGDAAVLGDAGALADGFRAAIVLPLLAVVLALRIPRSS